MIKKNIILIGSSGFIGSKLLNKIKNNNKIIQFNFSKRKNSFSINELEIKLNLIKRLKPEIILDLGWRGIPDYSLDNSLLNVHDKISFYEKILEIKSIKKIIVTGTCFEYKNKNKLCNEKDDITYQNNLSLAKITIYNYLKEKSKKYNFSLIWLRLFYVYGNGQREKSLIPYIINSFKNNKLPKIENQNNYNDFIHVSDVINLISKMIIKNTPSGIYNVGSGKFISVKEILQILCKIYKINYKEIVNLSKTKNYFYADISKISKLLKWKPKIFINQKVLKSIIKNEL